MKRLEPSDPATPPASKRASPTTISQTAKAFVADLLCTAAGPKRSPSPEELPLASVLTGMDGTTYEVKHAEGATIADIRAALGRDHGLVERTYTISGFGRFGTPDELGDLSGDARVAHYDTLFIYMIRASPDLITTFATYAEQGRSWQVTMSENNTVAEGPRRGYGRARHTSVRLGEWVDRATGALRARVQLVAGNAMLIGLVREEAWTSGRPEHDGSVGDLGWAYYTYSGQIYANGAPTEKIPKIRPAHHDIGHPFMIYDTSRRLRGLSPYTPSSGVVEVELRYGALYFRIDGVPGETEIVIPEFEGPAWDPSVHDKPLGRVSLAVSTDFGNCYSKIRLVEDLPL